MHPELFKYFSLCDKSSFLCKNEFYKLKKEVLMREGIPDGYDIRIVSRKNKLGPHKEVHFLSRWILNDHVFHLSCNRRPEGNPREIFYGLQYHVTDLEAVYYALIVLFLNYSPERLNNIIDNPVVQKLLQKCELFENVIYDNDFKQAVNQ